MQVDVKRSQILIVLSPLPLATSLLPYTWLKHTHKTESSCPGRSLLHLLKAATGIVSSGTAVKQIYYSKVKF